MIRNGLILAVLLPFALGLCGCASREEVQAGRIAQQAVQDTEDDAACREAGEPGSDTYETCRSDRSAKRARQAEIDYQKARDFDRVLGGLDDI